MQSKTFTLDGQDIPFTEGQTIMEAATQAGVYIPHLCYNPAYQPHGSCKLCTVKVNGRNCSACTFPAAEGQQVLNNTGELNDDRRTLTQMLFVEGNHLCPSCEKSGDCQLQAVGYYLGVLNTRFPHFFPKRDVDASHPDILLDRDRCIFCELCVRAGGDDPQFGIAGRGIRNHLVVNSPSGLLKDSSLSQDDAAAHVCPVGAILVKRQGFTTPIGQRTFDLHDISETALAQAHAAEEKAHD